MSLDPTTQTVDDLDALVACAAREASMRERVYPKFIQQGKMHPDDADHELLCMQAIVGILRHLRDKSAGVREFDFGS